MPLEHRDSGMMGYGGTALWFGKCCLSSAWRLLLLDRYPRSLNINWP
jgi:hypothetical protein